IEPVVYSLYMGSQNSVGFAEIIEMVVAHRHHARGVTKLLPQVVRLDAFMKDILGASSETVGHACEAGSQSCHCGDLVGKGSVQAVQVFQSHLARQLQGLVDTSGLCTAHLAQGCPEVRQDFARLGQGPPKMISRESSGGDGLGKQALRRQVQVVDPPPPPPHPVLTNTLPRL